MRCDFRFKNYWFLLKGRGFLLELFHLSIEQPDEAGEIIVLEILGEQIPSNSSCFQTTKPALMGLHETMEFVDRSSTISYILVRNGEGEFELPREPSIPINQSKTANMKGLKASCQIRLGS